MLRIGLVLLIATSLHAQTLPADPKSAVAEVLAALKDRDADRLLNVVLIESEEERPLARATVDLLIAGRRFADAATQRFGPAAGALADGPITPADAADLDEATIDHPNGNESAADVYLKGQVLPLKLRRIDGVWKLSISHYHGSGKDESSNVDRAATLRRQVALLQLTTAALNETVTEIDSDRYATPADLEAAIKQKLNFVLMRNLEATTRPG